MFLLCLRVLFYVVLLSHPAYPLLVAAAATACGCCRFLLPLLSLLASAAGAFFFCYVVILDRNRDRLGQGGGGQPRHPLHI